ncbi:MAG: ATP-binding protein [Myxococcota bacterium]
MFSWIVDKELRLQSGPNPGAPLADLFDDLPDEFPIIATRHALAGRTYTVAFDWDGQPWRVRVRPVRTPSGHVVSAAGVCAPINIIPGDPAGFTRSMVQQGRLFSRLRHDLNNLFGVIINYVDLAEREIASGRALTDELTQIRAVTHRAVDMVGDLRRMNNPLEARRMAVNLHRWLPRQLAQHQHDYPNVQITMQLAPKTPDLLVVEADLRLLLKEALSNAAAACGPNAEILVEARPASLDESQTMGWPANPGDFIQLTICDNGRGMPVAELQQAPEAYFSTRRSRGLGLTRIASIARQHGGIFKLDSAPDLGTTLTLYFPQQIQALPPEPSLPIFNPAGHTPRARARGAVVSHRILLADPTADVRGAMARVLNHAGYTVTEASGGDDVLRKFTGDPDGSDIVLIDEELLIGEHTDLAERLRTMKPNMPVVVAATDPPEVRSGDFLPKPCSPKSLLEHLRRLMG